MRPDVARLGLCALLAAGLCAPAAAAAQTQPSPSRPSTPPAIRYGKWVAFGLAAGFTALGAATHERADSRYAELLEMCRDRGPCPIGPDGRYANSLAEARYQRIVSDDRAARAWIIGGQAALVGAAALFVIELTRKGGPQNIPFSPYVSAGPAGTRLGVRVAWR